MPRRRRKPTLPPLILGAFQGPDLIFSLKEWLQNHPHSTPHNFFQWARSNGYRVKVFRTPTSDSDP